MWINTETNAVYKTGQAITVDGIQHPKSIFSLWNIEELAAIGIKPYREERVESRYYWQGEISYLDVGTEVVGSYATIPKDIGPLKVSMTKQVKDVAASKLAPTDWMALRVLDGGTAMPAEVKKYRIAVREASNTKEAEIAALNDLAAVMHYEATPYMLTRKVEHSDEEGNVTYGPDTAPPAQTNLNMVTTGGWPVDPLAEVDPAFVSLEPKP